jgi:putative addiction module antidote
MTRKITVRKMGGSLGATLPKEVTDRLQVRDGDTLYAVEREDGVLLTPYDPDFADAVEAFEVVRRQYRNTFRALAR